MHEGTHAASHAKGIAELGTEIRRTVMHKFDSLGGGKPFLRI